MRYLTILPMLTLFLAGMAVANAPDRQSAPALYDKSKDTLSVDASDIPLKDILGHIAMQSGIEILYDARADRPITANFSNRPFEEALKNLLKESNYTLRYSDQKGKKPLLIGIKVLPAGESSGNAVPLLGMQGEAFIQEKNKRGAPLSIEESERRNLSYERWKARLAELPPEMRENVEKRAKERLDRQENKRTERETRHVESKQRREQRRAQSEAERQKRLESLPPEERALLEQRREAAREMARQNQQQP